MEDEQELRVAEKHQVIAAARERTLVPRQAAGQHHRAQAASETLPRGAHRVLHDRP